MSNFIDLSNQTFGNLTVKERCEDYTSPKGKHLTQWLCECKCGNMMKVMSSNLKRSGVRRCRKCHEDYMSISYSKENKIEIDNNITYVYTTSNEKIIIDSEDWEKVKPYCWYINSNGYAMGTRHRVTKSKNIQLHRLIMDVLDKPDIIIDHKNGNPLDNRKCNLRKCTKAQNDYNKRMQPYNTSGVTGVTWDKSRNKWQANICYKGKCIHLGRFTNKQDAINARKQGEDKYFGEFSYNNSRNT